MTKPKKHAHSDHDYQQGYEQGVWDTENRLGDDIEESRLDRDSALDALRQMQTRTLVLEAIATQVVAYFGDLATTLRELTDLSAPEVDVLKRVTRDIYTPTPSAAWHDRRNVCDVCEGFDW